MSKTIIIVDDDPDMNKALNRLLSAAGYSITTFRSAEELLQANVTEQCQCFILDVQLPGCSGFELKHQLNIKGITAPVIFITAFDTESCVQRAKDVNALACLIKPFSSKQLLDLVYDAVSSTFPKNPT